MSRLKLIALMMQTPAVRGQAPSTSSPDLDYFVEARSSDPSVVHAGCRRAAKWSVETGEMLASREARAR
jgi:hypothetical protein